jgi:hypothetical protein
MRNRLVHFSHFAALTLLLSGCRDGGPNSEATALDPADPPASSPALGGTENIHFKARGAHTVAGFTLEQPGNVVFGHISVQRGGINHPGETLLFYFLTSCDHLTGECAFLEEGIGIIPNGDFTVNGKHSTLRTNTAANPSFILLTGSGGPIVLQWTRTTDLVSQLQEHRRTRTKALQMARERISSTSSTAIASGTMFGRTLGNSTHAEVGITRTGSIVLSKVP